MRAGTLIKQIAHGDGGAGCAGDLIAAQQLAARDFDGRTGLFQGGTGLEKQAADGCDGRKGFSAETERRNGEQIFDVAQFACGVALEGEQGIVAQHAATVVLNAEQTPACIFGIETNFRCARVERILEQLFGDRSGPLYDFSRRDFICDVVREDSYAAHRMRVKCWAISRSWRPGIPRYCASCLICRSTAPSIPRATAD